MGSACSSGEEARHHRENRKNRSNPTESYDTWQQKMLLDIGADPLAVVRDFPRMIVYVGTETHHNYLPPNSDAKGTSGDRSATASRRPSENPFAPSNGTPHKSGEDKTGPRITSANSKHTQGHHHGASHHRSGSAAGMNNNNNNNNIKGEVDPGRPPLSAAVSPSTSPPAPQRLTFGAGGGRASQREPFRDDDAFSARMKRVREEVLLLSELCHERSTFGAAFEAAWDKLVNQGSNNNNTAAAVTGAAAGSESEVASDLGNTTTTGQQQQQQVPTSATTRRTARNSLPLDVHQVLLNACVDSGMIALADEPAHGVPTSTTQRAMNVNSLNVANNSNTAANAAAGSQLPPPPSRTSPSGASRNSRPDSAVNSTLQLPETTTATTGLLSNEFAAVDYGTGEHAGKKSKDKHRHAQGKDAAKSASTSQIRSAPSAVAPGTPAVVPPASSRYVVRSATFHLMQFATQGVMFFPVQRLKHVLWVPWSSHMQDVSWTIHFTLKDATTADMIALKQHTLNALYNNASTVLSNEAAVDAVEAGMSNPNLTSTTSAVLAANRSSANAEQTADAFGAAATSALSDSDMRAAAAAAATGGASGTTPAPTRLFKAPGAADAKATRKIIVIQHVQTGRHYVEESDRKTTPRYELDWACSIRVDQDTLQAAFAPFQHVALQLLSTKPSPLAVDASTSAPPSLVRRSLTGTSDVIDGASPLLPQQPQPPQQREEIEEVEGLAAAQQPALIQHEVVASTVEVIAARVERPPHTMCMVSSTWKKRKEELDYVLEQQYKVNLEETDELHVKHLY